MFGEFGLQAATTRDIARRAGQNIAAITYHFHSKEGLYRAVTSTIADEVAHTYLPLRTEIADYLQRPTCTPEQHMVYLQKLVLSFTRLMTSPETLHFSRFISREQLSPTDAYPLVHECIIAPMHQLMTQLVAGYTRLDSTDRRTVIHTHALIGEALAFRVAREGWDDIGLEQSLVINDVVTQHIELVLDGLRAVHQR